MRVPAGEIVRKHENINIYFRMPLFSLSLELSVYVCLARSYNCPPYTYNCMIAIKCIGLSNNILEDIIFVCSIFIFGPNIKPPSDKVNAHMTCIINNSDCDAIRVYIP